MAHNCRKCDNIIPSRAKINGVYRVLNRRKFCLDCSPFGTHNTKQDDPARPAKRPLGSYSTWTLQAKRESARSVYERGINRKKTLVDMAGGKCTHCGYSNCLAALEFHHKDPTTKRFLLSSSSIRALEWTEVLKEYKKCELLCANCHREQEYFHRNK
jgi:hypothetical protein